MDTASLLFELTNTAIRISNSNKKMPYLLVIAEAERIVKSKMSVGHRNFVVSDNIKKEVLNDLIKNEIKRNK